MSIFRFGKRRPSPSMIISILALVVALGGTAGASTVSHVARLISGKGLQNSSVTGAKIKNGSLSGADLKDGSVGTADIGTFQVTDPDIAPDAIGGDKVKPNSLDGSDIVESALGQVPSAANADNASKLQGHPASNFVDTTHLQSWSVKASQDDDVVVAKSAYFELHAVCDPANNNNGTVYYIKNSSSIDNGWVAASDYSDSDFDAGEGDTTDGSFNFTDIGDVATAQLPNGAAVSVNGNGLENPDPTGFGADCGFVGSATFFDPTS
jgi:hypothetical protein